MESLEKAGNSLIAAANSIRNYLIISFLFGLLYGLLVTYAPTMLLWLQFLIVIYLISSILTIYGLLIAIKSAGNDLKKAAEHVNRGN